MKENPFFRSHWDSSSHPYCSPGARGIPFERPTAAHHKVVSIPVHFVGSEKTRSDSALRIQKALKGFLVRKSLKKITTIKHEVDEIAQRISKKEVVESIRKDSKEKLKVGETLMALLLKLDSIRGVDSGVRECRKTVTRKAIGLQERVDAIVSGEESCGAVGTDLDVNSGTGEGSQTESNQIESSADFQSSYEGIEDASRREERVGVGETSPPGQVGDKSKEARWAEGNDDNRQNRELLAKMKEDNERLMALMAELCERNEVQTGLLRSLTQRVEQLEKAFGCAKLRRKEARTLKQRNVE